MPESRGPGTPHIAYRTIVTLAALAVVVWGLKAGGTLLLPCLVSVFLAIVAAPPVLWLERKRVPVGVAVMIVMIGVLGATAGFGFLVALSVRDFSQAIERYRVRLQELLDPILDLLADYDIQITTKDLYAQIEPAAVMDWAGSTVGVVLSAVSAITVVVLTVLFILLEAAGFPRKLRAATSDPVAAMGNGAKIMLEIQRYLTLKTLLSLATGFLIWLWALVLGVDFPLLWGLLAFVLNYIPNVGSVIAAIPALLVAFVQLGPGTTGLLGLGYVVVNTVIGNVVEPQLMGNKLGLSPLVVFLSLLFWGWVWGPIGMLLSVPLTMVLKILLEQSEESSWLATLLGPTPR
ncbi:MAG: AI-2E family transporter [Nannocystaceae bacterium]|nr:AI-2E family transporter [Myxococcales bacterium]